MIGSATARPIYSMFTAFCSLTLVLTLSYLEANRRHKWGVECFSKNGVYMYVISHALIVLAPTVLHVINRITDDQ